MGSVGLTRDADSRGQLDPGMWGCGCLLLLVQLFFHTQGLRSHLRPCAPATQRSCPPPQPLPPPLYSSPSLPPRTAPPAPPRATAAPPCCPPSWRTSKATTTAFRVSSSITTSMA